MKRGVSIYERVHVRFSTRERERALCISTGMNTYEPCGTVSTLKCSTLLLTMNKKKTANIRKLGALFV